VDTDVLVELDAPAPEPAAPDGLEAFVLAAGCPPMPADAPPLVGAFAVLPAPGWPSLALAAPLDPADCVIPELTLPVGFDFVGGEFV
jgi:hypothetical protein